MGARIRISLKRVFHHQNAWSENTIFRHRKESCLDRVHCKIWTESPTAISDPNLVQILAYSGVTPARDSGTQICTLCGRTCIKIFGIQLPNFLHRVSQSLCARKHPLVFRSIQTHHERYFIFKHHKVLFHIQCGTK